MTLLPQGLPGIAEYERLRVSAELAEMRTFSSAFALAHPDLVRSDPLDQWSRRWEYPFAFEAVAEHVAGHGGHPYRVLDAGSGFTFFPFLLSERLRASVTCVDSSAELEPAFRRAAAGRYDVAFHREDLADARAFPDGAFDAVLCVSVLEHVPARDRHGVVSELRRLLRPGGLLVLTFDVAVESDYEIPLRDAEALLAAVSDTFPESSVPAAGSLAEAVRGDVLTTRRVAVSEPRSMPWRSPFLSTLGSLRHGFLPRSFGYRNLSVWCGRLVRAGTLAADSPPSGLEAESGKRVAE